ncbi:MAG: VCBS repeat-containing protein [Verrucomicrobia bacterium]|nr:VCBS repeat-containing protein [Verrucomicrobiota bacterium]
MQRFAHFTRPGPGAAALVAVVAMLVGCGRPERRTAGPAGGAGGSEAPAPFRPEPIGAAIGQSPWIAHVTTVDLDRDGRLDILACEAQENQVLWLRQTPGGGFEEKTVATRMKAPVHVEAVDYDGDGDLDLLVAGMGVVFPSNDRIGTVFVLENDGRQNFTPHIVLENTARVTDVRAADFNGDGKPDLVLAQFGYDQGEVCWMERTGPWEFRRHVVLELSGAINVCVADFNGDGRPDFAALISQQWEEIYCFENTGGGFARKRIWGSTNEDYGSSGLSVCDLNRDGRPDLLYTNGDGFGPAVTPGPRPWHGVQWLENLGGGNFRFRRICDLPGAYSPVGVDLDGDGATDVIAVAAYAGRNLPGNVSPSLVWFRNDGRQGFEPRVIASAPKDLITLAAGDFDGSGRVALVTGGFYVAAPYVSMGRITRWRR